MAQLQAAGLQDRFAHQALRATHLRALLDAGRPARATLSRNDTVNERLQNVGNASPNEARPEAAGAPSSPQHILAAGNAGVLPSFPKQQVLSHTSPDPFPRAYDQEVERLACFVSASLQELWARAQAVGGLVAKQRQQLLAPGGGLREAADGTQRDRGGWLQELAAAKSECDSIGKQWFPAG